MAPKPSSTTGARTLLWVCFLIATSCSANSTLGRLAGHELSHGRELTTNLPGMLQSEIGRSREILPTLENLGGGLSGARSIPDLMKGMSSELARPASGIERILYLWAHEWDRAAGLRNGSR